MFKKIVSNIYFWIFVYYLLAYLIYISVFI